MAVTSSCALIAVRMARGEWADFSAWADADRHVPASFIRDLMLGSLMTKEDHARIKDVHPEYGAFVPLSDHAPVPVTAAGVRVRGALIEGSLDLAGCSGSGGQGLPALALEKCRLVGGDMRDTDGKATIDISHAHIARLSLRDSQFTHIRGQGAVIGGSVDISGVRPLNGWTACPWPGADMQTFREDMKGRAAEQRKRDADVAGLQNPSSPAPVSPSRETTPVPEIGLDDCCWLDFSEARIGGEVAGVAAKLRAPTPRPPDSFAPSAARYALRLAGAEIGGGLDAVGGCVFDGGLNIHLARIRGEIWLGGAQLLAGESGALDGQGVEAGGLFAVGAPLRVCGGVYLMGARIERGIHLKAAELDGAGADALDADGISIGDDLLLWEGMACRGSIRLQGARIGGVLDMRNAFLGAGGRDALAGKGLSVGASALFREINVDGCIWLYGANITNRLDFNGASLRGSVPEDWGDTMCALSGTDIGVGNSVLLGRGFSALGSVRFQRARVEKDVGIVNATIHVQNADAVDLGWTKVSGNLILQNNNFNGWINLSHTNAGILYDNDRGYAGASRLYLNGFRFDTLHECDLSGGDLGCVRSRIAWLARMPNYQPQPYVHLARVLTAQGRTDEARDILIEKRDQDVGENWRTIHPGESQIEAIRRTLNFLFGRLFGAAFGYGLSPARAIRTLVVAFLVGWSFFAWADYHGAMVIDQQPVAGAVQGVATIGAPIITNQDIATNVPCGDAIQAPLYALDVFIPLVDLRQESRCDIGASRGATNLFRGFAFLGYRWGNEVEVYNYLKVLYALSGWVLISLSILTFSGVLQRVEAKE